MIKSVIIRIGIVLMVALIVVLGWGFFFYSGFYGAPPAEMPSYEQVVVSQAPSTDFSDVYEEGEGIVLIDLAHENAFDRDELNVLLLRLVSRGLTIKYLTEEDELKLELLGSDEEGEEELEGEPWDEEQNLEEEDHLEKKEFLKEEVPLPDAFIVVCPQREFSADEVDAVDEFVSDGGKLLLISDPTRYGETNSLSVKFGLIFEHDYLYNMIENELNYRNIFISYFKESEITKELEKIVLYTAGSVSSAEGGIAFVDENTFSNVVETRRGLSPVALSQEDKVLAICDLTFMTEPHNGTLDNNQLISNIADWLVLP